jgi:aldose sugar dehydrogenase
MKNNKLIIFLFVLIFLILAGYFAYGYLNLGQSVIQPGTMVDFRQKLKQATNITRDGAEEAETDVDYQITQVVSDLFVPWSMGFIAPDHFLVTERNGNVREVKDGLLNPNPIFSFEETYASSESGLMGLVLHPDFESNAQVYFCLTYQKNGTATNKVERLSYSNGSLSRNAVIIDDIPSARNHAGCRIKFGPDEKLYITTGDALERSLAQDTNSLAGKILRINDDGSIPNDNPFSNSPVFSFGHRNPQGISWHPSGVMYSTEHGPSGFDGPGGGDEINIIKPALNYGWPIVSHERAAEGMESPKLVFTPAEAPAGSTFYSGEIFPQFKNNFFFTALRGSGIFRVIIDENDPEEILAFEKLDIDFGRIRDIVESPDGLIYFATSNRDGRGQAREGDDKIYRFEPVE